ncbi:YcgL domain-containing protein [Neisseriaceae bacterium JH1-16]|nr:YcgL domain-containing protein [Neisseriaceae bacterium JH1-16]
MMKIDIYRPANRTDLYLFLREGANPHIVLADMLAQFGPLVLVKSRDIISGQKLVGISADEILANIERAGFHIQGVNITTQVSEGGAALGGGILGASVGGPIGAIIGAVLGYALAEHAKKVPDEL